MQTEQRGQTPVNDSIEVDVSSVVEQSSKTRSNPEEVLAGFLLNASGRSNVSHELHAYFIFTFLQIVCSTFSKQHCNIFSCIAGVLVSSNLSFNMISLFCGHQGVDLKTLPEN